MSPMNRRRDTNTRQLAALHERVAPDLLRYLERRVASPEDAADLLAETFLTAWRHQSRMPQGHEAARMWMFVTARNLSNNWRRGHHRRSDLATLLRTELATVAPATGSPSAEVMDTRTAVAALPDDLREIVTLVHWDGFTVPEAARIVGIRESTARGRYQRARGKLRDALQPIESQPLLRPESFHPRELRSNP